MDTAGVIRFAHWNADYKKRLAPDALLKAARKVIASPQAGPETTGQ